MQEEGAFLWLLYLHGNIAGVVLAAVLGCGVALRYAAAALAIGAQLSVCAGLVEVCFPVKFAPLLAVPVTYRKHRDPLLRMSPYRPTRRGLNLAEGLRVTAS